MIKIYINNEEVVCNNKLEINEDMLSTSSTILNNCYPKSWEETKDYVNNFYYPEDYSQCRIYHDENLIFCGVVKNTGNISLNPREPKYCSLEILDYKTFLSEGNLLDFVIDNKTISEAINMVVGEVQDYGFVIGDINIYGADDIIGAYNTQNKSAYDVFQYLADISGSRWFTRMIDEDTIAIDFYDPDFMEQATDIEYNSQFFEENKIEDITFSYSTTDYRNKQMILSDKVFGSIDYQEVILANGFSREFITTTDIGQINSITVNGVSATVGTSADEEIGVDCDFYYKIGEAKFTSNNNNNIYPANTVIRINYTPLIAGRQVVSNNSEIQRISSNSNRNGVVERYEDRNDVTSSDELLEIAKTYLKYKGMPEINLTVKTYTDSLYYIGQKLYFNAPLDELKKEYMVKSKKTKIYAVGENTWEVFYEYTLTSSFNAEKAVNWFDNQRNKTTGNINEGQYINRNIDLESSTTIRWFGIEINEVNVENDNVLDSSLDSTFIK